MKPCSLNKRVPVLEDIQAHSIGHGQAAPADRTNRTGRQVAVPARYRRGVRNRTPLQLPSWMLPMGEGNFRHAWTSPSGRTEIKLKAAPQPYPAHPPKRGIALSLMKNIDQVVLQRHNRFCLRSPHVRFKEGGKLPGGRGPAGRPLPHLGKAVKKKAVGLPLKPLGKRKPGPDCPSSASA